MRLFWKLFCSMIAITALACSLGGYLLVDSQFQTALESQAEAVVMEHSLLRYSLMREMKLGRTFDRAGAARLADSVSASAGIGGMAFRLTDEAGQQLAGSRLPAESELLQALGEERSGWEVLPAGDSLYLHAASPLRLTDGLVYLETWRDVDGVFQARQEQYRVFFYLMLFLILAVALLALAVSAWLSQPLKRLSEATKRVAAGELSERVQVTGDDEIGQLSADFNIMAEQMERQVRELTDAARRQEDFLHSFAHETKTPLTSIIGYAELLRARPGQPELVRESAAYIYQEGRRLESLSRKLMDLVVLDREGIALRAVEMPAFLERMAGTLRPALEQRGIRLEFAAEPGTVSIDPDLMESVCLNLLDNARKAVTGQGVIQLSGISEGPGYCIQVTDNGRGIPAEDLGRLTEAFYMVDKSRSRAEGGAGLGLSVCQRIVALHGDTMEFESTPGQGTSVRVHLKGGVQS